MAIPSRQIGWSTTDNLLWQISKQVESLGCVVACGTSGGGSGTSGSSGTSGVTGTSGSAGTSGLTGSSGSSGLTGTSGLSGDRYRTESVTEFTLGVSTVLTVGTGLSYTVAQDVIIAYDSANHEIATVVSYDSGTGILVIGPPITVIGSGTYSDWTVNLNGAAGGDGSSGTSGSSGVSGTAGTSGIAGTSGSAGTSGANGANGSSGTSGTSGTSGVNGTAGTAGITGTSGTSGSTPTTYYGAFIFNTDTTLTTAIPNPSSTATIQVVSTTGFLAPGYMKIGTEIIGYTAVTPTTFTGITRGVANSTATSHAIGDFVAQAQATTANTPTQVKLDQTDLSVGVSLSGLGDITIANAGVYNMQFSIQLQNYGNAYDDAAVWFRLNGNDIPQTTSYTTVVLSHAGTPGAVIMTVNIFYTIAASDVVSLAWLSKSGDTVITSVVPIGATLPTSPGVIFTVNKIA